MLLGIVRVISQAENLASKWDWPNAFGFRYVTFFPKNSKTLDFQNFKNWKFSPPWLGAARLPSRIAILVSKVDCSNAFNLRDEVSAVFCRNLSKKNIKKATRNLQFPPLFGVISEYSQTSQFIRPFLTAQIILVFKINDFLLFHETLQKT